MEEYGETTLSYYPRKDDDNFARKIASKKEFKKSVISNETSRTEHEIDDISQKMCKKGDMVLLPQQEFLKNFMSNETPYNGILIKHGTGTGKTCASISIVEEIMPNIIKHNKQAHIIVPSRVEDNFKREIFNVDKYLKNPTKNSQCTGEIYTENITPHLGKKKILKFIDSKVKKKYWTSSASKDFLSSSHNNLHHYITFATYVKNLKDKGIQLFGENGDIKNIKNVFSNTVLVIDEVHNLRDNILDAKASKQKEVRTALMDVIKYSENLKIVLMSATPMYNKPSEIIFILNLLILNDIPQELRVDNHIINSHLLKENDIFDEDHSLKPGAEEKLRTKSKGYISYLRGDNPYTFPAKLKSSGICCIR